MNQKRRKKLDEAIFKIRNVSDEIVTPFLKSADNSLEEATLPLIKASIIIETAAEEEQESFDNLSEGLQCSLRGYRMEDVAEGLTECSEQLLEVRGDILKYQKSVFENLNKCDTSDVVNKIAWFRGRLNQVIDDIEELKY